MGETYLLELRQDGYPEICDGNVLLLPFPKEPYVLRIILPGSSPLLNETDVLKCNFPKTGDQFDRPKFHDYKLEASIITKNAVVDIEITHSGAFEVQLAKTTAWNFVVANGFTISNNEVVTGDSLCVQTLLSKLVGGDVRSKRWQQALDSIADKNYNMIHFVPLQKRGESGSPFSIEDQLSWDAETFPQGEQDVAYLVEQLESRGIIGLSDIVLNHTASNSAWLRDHLDAGYNPETAPHLRAAIDLDTELLKAKDVKIRDAAELDKVVNAVVANAAETTKLWEYYVVDVETLSQTVAAAPFRGNPRSELGGDLSECARRLTKEGGKNFGELGARFWRTIDSSLLAEFVAATNFSAVELLNEVNVALYKEYNDDLNAAITSIKDRQRYLRLDSNGPQIGDAVNSDTPIIETYFNREFGLPLASNGWVWAGNPLVDHAGPKSRAYIRRELIVWQDCVKLRYGEGAHDSPFLWDYMAKYARMLAKYFGGLRIDNCHSTPLHVGEFILDEARRVRPNLYVVAELFSGSKEMDKLYVERLGIGSLLREAIMASNPADLSTIVHQNGGLAIGSFFTPVLSGCSTTHSWLMEVTHDNETLAEKRTVEDTLPTAGLVAMCQAASGCTMGNDECYPHALNVVSESRPYTFGGGISEAKAVLNKLHIEMGQKNMVESFTDHQGQYITVHRIDPYTGEGYFLIARTKFWEDDAGETLAPVNLEASNAEWVTGWSLRRTSGDDANAANGDGTGDDDKIIPISTELVTLDPISTTTDNGSSVITVDAAQFPQGSIAIWKTSRSFDASYIEKLVTDIESAKHAVDSLNLVELNRLLYCVENEERTITEGKQGVYDIPNYGPLVYAGLQGWESILKTVVLQQDLGHPLCDNLRNGLWAFEYLASRGTESVNKWVGERLEATRKVPSFLRPRYFAATVFTLYLAATNRALSVMGVDPHAASKFYRRLALTSVQMVNLLPNCSLFPETASPTMAAGLPFFSEGIMRCWGRDVFLSIGGLLVRLNRFEEAEQHILGFGATLKYGLIPNLLDSGRNPRYNARDACWFFVESIQQFCKTTNSLDLLNKKVKRRFPLNDEYTEAPTATESTVGELVFEILARHAKGIEFREHNAGPQIDMHMKSNGFNQRIWTDWETGIVFGGNQDNCGTWQDKMGESVQAGSEGVPGTPRDGAAIEITAMLKSCLRWVNEVRKQPDGYKWPESVETSDGKSVSTEEWEQLIQKNFERAYYIPESQEGAEGYDIDWKIVNRKGIYKDVYRSGKPYEDYQLRANFTVAVVVAPELFDVDKISKTLELADKVLRGPLGMATLDPSDWNYRPYYINGVESSDFATSRGRNYHQGPEWVWLFGTFLQAYVHTLKRKGADSTEILAAVRDRIQRHVTHINDSLWAGLPELTQKNGEHCPDSSPSQAWSSARLIEAICLAAAD